MKLLRMSDLDLAGKRVLIREDLNVPVAEGQVTSDARIRAALPTLQLAIERGARVLRGAEAAALNTLESRPPVR